MSGAVQVSGRSSGGIAGYLGAALRGRAAWVEADFLDRLVDAELEFVRRLPAHLRAKPAEALAVLVMLAQDHRYYALGWISRRALRRRAERAVTDLDSLREATTGGRLR
ncbi:MAG: hypothetical protein ACRDTF_24360 [Pseudonocardiaceae bacterium]